MAHLALSLLGTFQVTRDYTPITKFASNKVRGLLVYLAVESDRPHTREALGALLWPELPNHTALTNLRNALANLRQVIGDQQAQPPFLHITHDTIQFNRGSDTSLDVLELIRLAETYSSAIAESPADPRENHLAGARHYRGPFLAGFSIPDSVEFEEWATLWRERLGQIALEALRWLADYYEACDEYTSALDYALRWVALDPWLEEGHRQIMRILAITGQRGAALAHYETCKRLLAEDLGIEPAEETRSLVDAICAGQIERLHARQAPPVPGEPPYRGLCFFDEVDADLFFGRELLSARLAASVEEMAGCKDGSIPLLVVVGASGSGKSSLVRAGVIPILRKKGWKVQVITPTTHPLTKLQASVVWDQREDRTGRRLLVIDQFEELFSLVRDESQRMRFLERILDPDFPVLLVLRADFYGHCAPYPRLRSALSARQEYIGAMDTDGLRRAIEQPARRLGWELEPGLVNLLLQDIGVSAEHAPEPGALPLLEHALLETWAHRRGRRLTLAGYAEAGGVHQAIARTAERVYGHLSPPEQAIARCIFLRLTELGEGTLDTRCSASVSELHRLGHEPQEIDDLLSTLAAARLVTLGEETVEVAHEALIREWPKLRRWLTEGRDGLRLHRRLSESAAAWERMGRDAGDLYRGTRLAQALEWAAQNEHSQELTLLESEFLRMSHQQEEFEACEREAQRLREIENAQRIAEVNRLRAEERERAARLATSRELAAHSKSRLAAEPDLSLLLALKAVAVLEQAGLNIPWDVQQSVHEVALADRLIWSRETINQPWTVAFSPDGNCVFYEDNENAYAVDAITGAEIYCIERQGGTGISIFNDGRYLATANGKQACLWEPHTGQKLLTIPLPGQDQLIGAINAISPDGRYLHVCVDADTGWLIDLEPWLKAGSPPGLTISMPHKVTDRCSWVSPGYAFSPDGKIFITPWVKDNTYTLWDTQTAQPLRTLSGHTFPMAPSFHPGGSRLATCGVDRSVRIWDLNTGKELVRLGGHTGEVSMVVYSPDGLRLASTGAEGTVIIWDSETGMRLFDLPAGSCAYSAAFHPDGKRLFVSAQNRAIQMWDVTSSGPGEIGTAVFSPHREYSFNSCDHSRIIDLYTSGIVSVRDARTFQEITIQQVFPDAKNFVAVGLSQDNNYLAATRQGAVKVWDLRSGQRIYEQPGLDEDGNPFFNMHPAFSPDGKFLATSPHPKSITIRNVFTGEIYATLPVYYGISHWCEFSADGKLFAHGGARILWNLGGGEANTGGGGALTICKLPANNQDWSDPIQIGSDVRAINRFHFSPNSQRIVVCGGDNQANIWDTQSGEFVFPLLGHHARINDAQYSPDGRYIVTASIDGSVKIWEAESGIELLSYNFPGYTRFDIAFFTPDGKQVVAVSEDNHYRMLAFQNFNELVNIVRGRITREWKPEERRRYLRQEVSV